MTLEAELKALEAETELKKLAIRHEGARQAVQTDKSASAIAAYKALSKELQEARSAARAAGIRPVPGLAGVPVEKAHKRRRLFGGGS